MGADAVVLADVRAQNADLQKQITQAQERIFKLSSDLTHSNASQSEVTAFLATTLSGFATHEKENGEHKGFLSKPFVFSFFFVLCGVF